LSVIQNLTTKVKELSHTSEVAIGITFTRLDSTSIGSEAIITVAMRWGG
jgi:hypothetical protein